MTRCKRCGARLQHEFLGAKPNRRRVLCCTGCATVYPDRHLELVGRERKDLQ